MGLFFLFAVGGHATDESDFEELGDVFIKGEEVLVEFCEGVGDPHAVE